MGRVGVVLEIDVIRKRDPPRVHLKDVEPSFFIGNADFDLPVKPSAPAECRVDRIRKVGRRDNDDLPPPFQAVHQGK